MSNYEEELFTGLASFNLFSFNAGPLGKLTYPYICCMFCWALDTVMPLRRTMKPSLIYLEWVNRNWKKERTCLDGCVLFGACHVRHGLQTATRTLAHLTVWQTHTNISYIFSQTLSLVILHALFLQALNGIYYLLLLFTSMFILKVVCILCSLWTFSVFMKQLD